MKKILLFLFAINTFNVQGQTHTPFKFYNTGWNILGYQMDQLYQLPVIIDRYQFYFYGDSIINSNYSHKCYFNLKRIELSSGTIFPLDSGHYVGAIRNNGLKYYFTPKDSLNERLIYDFSLSVGDTAPLGYYPYQTHTKTITFIDTATMLDNSIRTRYHYNYVDSLGNFQSWSFYWDGIGEYRSLIDTAFFLIQNYDGGTDIYSYCENGSFIYQNPNFSFSPQLDCFFPVTVLEYDSKPKVNLYPNPIIDNLNINLGKIYSKINLTITNAIGNTIHKENYSNSEFINIKFSNLECGIYFIQLKMDDKYSIHKFVKSNY